MDPPVDDSYWFSGVQPVKHNLEERSLKKHARCVLSFVCLIFFCLFNLTYSAVAQETTLATSKPVVFNLSKAPWRYLGDQDPANFPAPGFYDSGWQQAGVPNSADRQYAKSKVGLRRHCTSRFQSAPDRDKSPCQELETCPRRSSA